MEELTKEKRIAEELKRIEVFFADLADNKKAIVAPLLQNAAFMKITLDDLQELINTDGVVDVYQNGANQNGTKQSATLQSYNSLIKNYTTVTKKLFDLLPYVPEKRELWQPVEKTEEEREAEWEREKEHQRKLREELDRAVELQRKQREEWAARGL